MAEPDVDTNSTDDIDAITRHLAMAAGIAGVASNAGEEGLPANGLHDAMWAIKHHLELVGDAAARQWAEVVAHRRAREGRGTPGLPRPVLASVFQLPKA
jgi:hypothetical protein